jgi:hypothetical protein
MLDLNYVTAPKNRVFCNGNLRSVAVYTRIYKKGNIDIRHDLKIFNLEEKLKEYQENYFEHILRMLTSRLELPP